MSKHHIALIARIALIVAATVSYAITVYNVLGCNWPFASYSLLQSFICYELYKEFEEE